MATLSKLPRANEEMQLWGTRTGASARLSDPDSWGEIPNAKIAVTNAHQAAHEAIQYVDRLTKDTTRTPPQLHDLARRAVSEKSATIMSSAQKLTAIADEFEARAVAAVDEYADLNKIPQVLAALKIQWIKDAYKTETGVADIRKAVESDPHQGAIFNRTDSYLLGVSDNFRQSMIGVAVDKWLPEAKRDQATADRLRETASKLAKFTTDLHNNSYSTPIADQMTSRVED